MEGLSSQQEKVLDSKFSRYCSEKSLELKTEITSSLLSCGRHLLLRRFLSSSFILPTTLRWVIRDYLNLSPSEEEIADEAFQLQAKKKLTQDLNNRVRTQSLILSYFKTQQKLLNAYRNQSEGNH